MTIFTHAAAGAAAAVASSSGFLYYALAWPLFSFFFFVFLYLCVSVYVWKCVVTLPPFWHSPQQQHSKRAASQLSKFENERKSERATHTQTHRDAIHTYGCPVYSCLALKWCLTGAIK